LNFPSTDGLEKRATRMRLVRWLRRLNGLARTDPKTVGLTVLALALAAYVLVYPFVLARYPPITDLPFHAASTSILRHYFAPSWHFREQFSVHFLEAPYASMYVIGALCALVMPIAWATKVMAIAMLSLLPAGLAVMFHGMKKSPFWGLLGLGLAYGTLTHWGFLNFLGAIGLFAMAIGFALLVVDRPSRRRQIALGLCLIAILFTHVFRLPFALAAVIGTGVLMYPATRRFRPLLLPMAPTLAAFALWASIRPRHGKVDLDSGGFGLRTDRFREIPEHLFSSYVGPEERLLASQAMWIGIALFAITAVAFLVQGRHRRRIGRDTLWGVGVTVLPLLLAGGFLLGYLVLPLSIEEWWFVYPREITPAVFIALGAMPDLPRQWWLRAPVIAAIAFAVGRMSFFTARQWHDFDSQTADFAQITRPIERAPKLLYLVFDHTGSTRTNTPFIHLPAWVQAEKGGWLSFHFASWNVLPVRYRPPGPDVPPARPTRWEWTPERFEMRRDGQFFDTFLVRDRRCPDYLFSADPMVRRVDHVGTWWLYRRAE
jgi:hypothetical protein